MKTTLITSLALAGWTAAAAEPQTNGTVAVRDVFSAGADFRIRQEIMDNLPGMPGDAYSATPALRAKYRNQIRFRPRVWFAAETGPFRLYARVADEFREYPTLHTPREERAYNFPDEVFLDNLYLEGRGLSVAGLETIDFRIGRQDLMEGGHSIYGLDRIIVEGTPTDGSRNFYSDMVRATLHFDAAKKLDVFALYDSGRSDLRWGNSRSRGRSLNCINMTDTSDLDEWGGGLVYSQNAFDGDLPFKVYAMFKRDEAHTTQKPAPRRVSAKERTTFGVFLEPRLTDNWDLELEAAQQVGRIVDSGRFAGGTMAHAAVNYRMDALRTYRPTLTWATTYYSGDSDCTKDGVPIGATLGSGEKDSHGNVQMSGTGALGDYLARELKARAGVKRVRADTFGYLQRSFPGVQSKADLDEAMRAGAAAVIAALPAADAAKYTRSVPKEFIAKSGHDVTPAFLAYAKPLVGDLPPCEVL